METVFFSFAKMIQFMKTQAVTKFGQQDNQPLTYVAYWVSSIEDCQELVVFDIIGYLVNHIAW